MSDEEYRQEGWWITTDHAGMTGDHPSGAKVRLDHKTGQVSDGFHAFDELYRYRMLYNAALFNLFADAEWPKDRMDVHKSWQHADGEDPMFPGMFRVAAELPTGQISNHYEAADWDLFQIPEQEFSDPYDGHTSADAADRLERWLRGER